MVRAFAGDSTMTSGFATVDFQLVSRDVGVGRGSTLPEFAAFPPPTRPVGSRDNGSDQWVVNRLEFGRRVVFWHKFVVASAEAFPEP